MNKIIEVIIKTVPFAAAFGYWGLSKDLSKGLASIVLAVVLYFVSDYLKKWQVHRKNQKMANNLAPYYNYQKVSTLVYLFLHNGKVILQIMKMNLGLA